MAPSVAARDAEDLQADTINLRETAGTAASQLTEFGLALKGQVKKCVRSLRGLYDLEVGCPRSVLANKHLTYAQGVTDFHEFEPPQNFNELIKDLQWLEQNREGAVEDVLNFETGFSYITPVVAGKDQILRCAARLRRVASEEPLRSQPITPANFDQYDDEVDDEITGGCKRRKKVPLGFDETALVAFDDNKTVRRKLRQELEENIRTVHTLLSDALVPWKEDLARVPPDILEEYTTLMEANEVARRTELLRTLWATAMADDEKHLNGALYQSEMRQIRALSMSRAVTSLDQRLVELFAVSSLIEARLARRAPVGRA